MKIELGTEWEAFIDDHVQSGRYQSASEVVGVGLRLLQQLEQSRQVRIDELRDEVNLGLDALDRGDYLELDDQGLKEYFQGVNKRGHERLFQQQANTG